MHYFLKTGSDIACDLNFVDFMREDTLFPINLCSLVQ